MVINIRFEPSPKLIFSEGLNNSMKYITFQLSLSQIPFLRLCGLNDSMATKSVVWLEFIY